MRWRFPNLAMALSMLLCVATVMLWVRSWHKGQSIERVDPNRRIMVTSMYGLIQLKWWDGVFEPTLGIGNEPGHAPNGTWQKWMYWHGREFGDTGPADWAYPPSMGREHWWQALGFDAFDRQVKPRYNSFYLHDWLPGRWTGRERSVTVPHWAVMAVFSFLPLIAVARIVRRIQRLRSGLCPSCGYNLRASPDRCPECGTVASK